MARSSRVLAALSIGTAVVAAAAGAFVNLPTRTHRGPEQLRHVELAEKPSSMGLSPEAIPTPEVGSEQTSSFLRWIAAGLVAGLLLAVFSAPAKATEDAQIWTSKAKNLELCKDNKKYHKKIKDQIYKITQRQKKYPKGSVVFNRFEKKIAQVKRREEAYGDRYCGKKDGLPRVIATGENVRGGVVIPGLMFLYTAGWIGWAGRSYLLRTQDEMKELNIDVPLALTCMASGFSWPVAAWQAIVNGEMVKKDTDLHRSFF